MNYGYSDLPDSYRRQAKCSICENISYVDTKTDYYGKTTYYCKACRDYHKLDGQICQKVSISASNYSKLGSYTPSGCYITTIVCKVLGFPDDSEILDTLRIFRDNYLKRNERFLPLLAEYDVIGPKISEKLANDRELCIHLFRSFLVPCTYFIRRASIAKNEQEVQENYEQAVIIYQNMVEDLRSLLELPATKIDNTNYDLETIGKGRIRVPDSDN